MPALRPSPEEVSSSTSSSSAGLPEVNRTEEVSTSSSSTGLPEVGFPEVKRRRLSIKTKEPPLSLNKQRFDLLPVDNYGKRPEDLLNFKISKEELKAVLEIPEQNVSEIKDIEEEAERWYELSFISLLRERFIEFVEETLPKYVSLRDYIRRGIGGKFLGSEEDMECFLERYRKAATPFYFGPILGSILGHILLVLEPHKLDENWRRKILEDFRTGNVIFPCEAERQCNIRKVCEKYERCWRITPLLLAAT